MRPVYREWRVMTMLQHMQSGELQLLHAPVTAQGVFRPVRYARTGATEV